MKDDIYLQIANGIAEAVNGEGNSEQMLDDIRLNDDGSITVLLAALSPDRLSELVAEIQARISHWRVNPFDVIDYGGGRTITFFLKPDKEIRRLYDRQRS